MLPGNEYRGLEVKTKITQEELRRLLVGIHEHQRHTGFRFRLMGQLWHPAFLSVISVSDQDVLLLDITANKLVSVSFGHIMQFEIELRFQEFLPNFHYTMSHVD